MYVKLREKKLKDGKVSLYLDTYINGKRKYEYLKLFNFINPKTQEEKNNNKRNSMIAHAQKIAREQDLIDSKFNLPSSAGDTIQFAEYFKILVDEHKKNAGSYGNWQSAHQILLKFLDGKSMKLSEVSESDLSDLKKFLLEKYKTKSNKNLSTNAASSYFSKYRIAVNRAFDDQLIVKRITSKVKSIGLEDTTREFLTADEIKLIINTPCENVMLKNAFLFSVYTGLRWSDVVSLKWGQIEHVSDKDFIRFKQQKTAAYERVPLNTSAKTYLGNPGSKDEKIFEGLKYSAWHNLKLSQWMLAAGITKKITFHCARHTYATMLLSKGVDIYVVSKLLGHKNLKTTEIYGKVIDLRREEAVMLLDSL
jgi:integrase